MSRAARSPAASGPRGKVSFRAGRNYSRTVLRTLLLAAAFAGAQPTAARAGAAAPPAGEGGAPPPPAGSKDAAPPMPSLSGPAGPGAATATSRAMRTVSFDEAVALASVRNVSAEVAREEIYRVEGLLDQARSYSLPTLVAGGAVTRLDSDRRSPTGQLFQARDQQEVNVTLTLPLIAPSRWYQWSHASDQLGVARASQADVRRQVTLLAGRAYLSVVAQKRIIDVDARSVAAARAHFDYSRARRQGGVGNALDEARADQQLGTAEAQLENAFTALARAQEALGQAAGLDEPLDARAEPELRVPSRERALRDAEELRQDVRASRERTRAADRVARDSWADWLPTLVGTAQPFWQHPPNLITPETGWQAQLVLTFPIFEGFLRHGQLHERDALAAEAASQLDGLLRQARSDVRLSFEALGHAEQAFVSSRRAAEQANLALQLAATAYRAGANTNIDVIDAEQRARDADTAAVQAEDAVRQSRLDLLAATGHFP